MEGTEEVMEGMEEGMEGMEEVMEVGWLHSFSSPHLGVLLRISFRKAKWI